MIGFGNLKLIAIAVAIAAAIGVPSWAAWKLGNASGKEEVQESADKQVAQMRWDMQQLLIKQTQLTDHYQTLADDSYAKLMDKLGHIKVEHVTITKNITTERAANPDYYEQRMPDGGIKEWEAARKLFR